MQGHARYSSDHGSGYRSYDASDRYADGDVAGDDRLGELRARRRRRALRGAVLALMVLGGTWAWLNGWLGWLGPIASELATAITTTKDKGNKPTAAGSSAIAEALPPLELVVAREVGAAPGSSAGTEAEAEKVASAMVPAPLNAPLLANTGSAEAPAPLPKVVATDPLGKRAEAVGLHPDLSRVLLSRLSETDFRNAGIAIRKAVAEVPEDGALEWPRDRSPALARFRVHFVPGVDANCRRYVVAIAKDGWLTTALPMEKCGIKPPAARKEPERAKASGGKG